MKANELRIGNIVYLKSKQKEWVISDGYEIDEGTDSDDFEPIPLTEEWLFKFGFKFNEDAYWSPVFNLTSKMKIKNYDGLFMFPMNRFRAVSLSYVHQLQNLVFALFGEELKIEKI